MTPPDGGPARDWAADDVNVHRAPVFDALSRHPDPVLREMGRQLAAGALAPRELLRDPHYVEELRRRFRKITELDDEVLRARILGARRPEDRDPGEGGVPASRR